MKKRKKVDFDSQFEKWQNEQKSNLSPEEMEEVRSMFKRIVNGDLVGVE